MKKLINDPLDVLREMPEGAVSFAPDLALLSDENVVVQDDGQIQGRRRIGRNCSAPGCDNYGILLTQNDAFWIALRNNAIWLVAALHKVQLRSLPARSFADSVSSFLIASLISFTPIDVVLRKLQRQGPNMEQSNEEEES